jgi:hypothetical protein
MCIICKSTDLFFENKVCEQCLSEYKITNNKNEEVILKYTNGYICYYVNDIKVPYQQIFINGLSIKPYIIQNKLTYLKNRV